MTQIAAMALVLRTERWLEFRVPLPTPDHSSPSNDYGLKIEEQVERLVTDISRVIQAAEPAKRAGLKELAETLLHEEISTISEESQAVESQVKRSRVNPLAAGILLILLGLGMFVIVPFIGLTLGLIGLVLAIWGGTMSFFRK